MSTLNENPGPKPEAEDNPEVLPNTPTVPDEPPDQTEQDQRPDHEDHADDYDRPFANPNAPSGIPMPLGIIDAKIDDGATFTMTRPDDHERIAPGASVTVWDIYTPLHALARYRGIVTEVNENTAAFAIQAQEIDDNWPSDMDPISPGNAVYLAQPDSYTFDGRRIASHQELGQMWIKAKEFQERTGITTSGPRDIANRAIHLANLAKNNNPHAEPAPATDPDQRAGIGAETHPEQDTETRQE